MKWSPRLNKKLMSYCGALGSAVTDILFRRRFLCFVCSLGYLAGSNSGRDCPRWGNSCYWGNSCCWRHHSCNQPAYTGRRFGGEHFHPGAARDFCRGRAPVVHKEGCASRQSLTGAVEKNKSCHSCQSNDHHKTTKSGTCKISHLVAVQKTRTLTTAMLRPEWKLYMQKWR